MVQSLNLLTAWNFCLLCWAVDGFDEVMLNPVEGKEVTAMTGWLITWAFIGLIGSGVLKLFLTMHLML